MSTWQDLITDALYEIGAYSPAEPIQAQDVQLGVRKTNDIIDMWAARKAYIYATSFQLFTLIPNLSPHTIGPAALSPPTFVVPQRPERIESASLVLTDVATGVDQPMNLRDSAWWALQRVKLLTTSVPTDVYYEPDYPNGSLYFWPVPDFGYDVRLELWSGIIYEIPVDSGGAAIISGTFVAPPGYRRLLTLTLAEDLCNAMGRPVPADLPEKIRRATVAVQSDNIKSPRTASADYGTRGKTGPRRADFNWVSGMPS